MLLLRQLVVVLHSTGFANSYSVQTIIVSTLVELNGKVRMLYHLATYTGESHNTPRFPKYTASLGLAITCPIQILIRATNKHPQIKPTNPRMHWSSYPALQTYFCNVRFHQTNIGNNRLGSGVRHILTLLINTMPCLRALTLSAQRRLYGPALLQTHAHGQDKQA